MSTKTKGKPQQQQPSAFWLPGVDAAAAGTLFGWGIKWAEHRENGKTVLKFDPEKPISIAVLKTENVTRQHKLEVRVKNWGIHGVYITGVALSDAKTSGKCEVNKISESKPLFIPPEGQGITFEIGFYHFSDERLKKPHGTLRFSYVIAGIAKGAFTTDVDFFVFRPRVNTRETANQSGISM